MTSNRRQMQLNTTKRKLQWNLAKTKHKTLAQMNTKINQPEINKKNK